MDNQGSFRKNRSAVSSIISLSDGIMGEINESKFTLAAYIDLRKAFDTVNHEGLEVS